MQLAATFANQKAAVLDQLRESLEEQSSHQAGSRGAVMALLEHVREDLNGVADDSAVEVSVSCTVSVSRPSIPANVSPGGTAP